MWARRSETQCLIHTPAKLNLHLEILARRSDGFHELETLMVPIALYDTLLAESLDSAEVHFRLIPTIGDSKKTTEAPIPAGSDNLVVRAIDLFREHYQIDRGIRLTLWKRIPSQAGIGGGSSDAAAALLCAARLWQVDTSWAELGELAGQLGSDVPFFLGRGAAICRGRGERIEQIPLRLGESFVVMKPPIGLATADVYRVCEPAREPTLATEFIRGWRDHPGRGAGKLTNRLEPAAAKLTDRIGHMKALMGRAGSPTHQLSGSGSAYFGWFPTARAASRAAGRLRASGVGEVFVTRSCRGLGDEQKILSNSSRQRA